MHTKLKGLVPIIICLFMVFPSPSYGQKNDIRFDSSCSIDWVRGKLDTQASFDLAQAGIKLPTGRYTAEETLSEAYPLLLRSYLLSIKADSNSTIKDLVEQREISFEDLDILCQEDGKITPNLSADLRRMTGKFSIPMGKISALLVRQKRPVEAEKPLIPVLTADYTGIIIVADKVLPVHGRNAQVLLEPCLFPRIWDTNMNLVYERNMVNPDKLRETLMVSYAVSESVFRPTPSGLEGELAALVGPNPLRILAREVFGIYPTDPVIDREDALKILSTENNRHLLREGRVVLVLDEGVLQMAVQP